jgi:formylglycine-generating enzyme required for sulfatase activity
MTFVWEWCEDIYDEGFYGKAEARVPDPVSHAGSVGRIFRGGCWSDFDGLCRSSTRSTFSSVRHEDRLGFRPAHPVP